MAKLTPQQAHDQLCEEIDELKACVAELKEATQPTLTCEEFCAVVVGELENVDGPINLNPLNATPIAWGGFQSQDDEVVSVDGSEATIAADDVCTTHVTASVTFVNADGGTGATGNAQRAHPELWLLRDGSRVALAQTYIRDANGQDSDTATINWYDLNPVTGTTYSLEVQRDSIETAASGQATATLEIFRDPETASYLQVAAHRRFELCSTSEESGPDEGGQEGAPSLPAAGGKVVSDNFQDGNGNAPFNLQVRNTTNAAVNWEALVSNVPYATIPGLVAGNYTLTSTQNTDGTWNHLFTGTQPLGAFQNVTITGGLPIPAGTGSGLTLYCESA